MTMSCHVNAAILGHLSIHNIPKGNILCIYTLWQAICHKSGHMQYALVCVVLYDRFPY